MKRFKRIVLAAMALLVGVAYALPAPEVQAQSSAALSIVPKKNYTIEAGKSIKDTLTIRNLDDVQPLQLTLRVVDFTYNDDGGTPKLMLAEDAPQTTWSLKPFIDLPDSVTIAPKSSKTVDMSVAIPANQGAGSFYSAILYSSGAPDGGNVGLSASGVTLAFATVPGEVNENLKLEKFGAYQVASQGKEAGYKFMTMDEPQMMAYTLKNEGNVTASPVGTIKVKHMFGKEYSISDVNPNQSLALIGQTRTFSACIKLKNEEASFNGTQTQTRVCESAGLWPGYYSSSLELFYGQNGNQTKEIVGSASFWYLPGWFIIAMIVVLLALAYFIWRTVYKIRNRSHAPKSSKIKLSSRRK